MKAEDLLINSKALLPSTDELVVCWAPARSPVHRSLSQTPDARLTAKGVHLCALVSIGSAAEP